MKVHFLFFGVLLLFINCNRISSNKVVLDENIKSEALKNINITDSPTIYSTDSIYQTTYIAKLMAADTVVFNNLDNVYLKKDFMCNHYYDKDTLIIRGGFGARFQMYGFVAKVFPDKTTDVKLRLYWGYPSYFTTIDQEQAKSEILVRTKTKNLVLSNLPKQKADRSHIFGLVDFVSDPYYVEMKDPKTQKSYKEKNTFQFKIYFDSRYFDDSKVE